MFLVLRCVGSEAAFEKGTDGSASQQSRDCSSLFLVCLFPACFPGFEEVTENIKHKT